MPVAGGLLAAGLLAGALHILVLICTETLLLAEQNPDSSLSEHMATLSCLVSILTS